MLFRFQVGPNILQFLTHVWVQPEDLDSLLDHYVRERWGVPTIETFVPDPRPNTQNKVRPSVLSLITFLYISLLVV